MKNPRILNSILPNHGDVGPLTILVLTAAYALLWFVVRPSGESGGSYWGQLFGALSILLMSIALILVSTLAWVEGWFRGLDRALIWHRRVAITGLLLLIPHILTVSGGRDSSFGGTLAITSVIGLAVLVVWAILPRIRAMLPFWPKSRFIPAEQPSLLTRLTRMTLGGYERWRTFHRAIGLFVAAGFIHGVLDASVFGGSPVLRWSYLAVGGIGVAFYAYRELLARFFLPQHDYKVKELNVVSKDMVEVVLAPMGRPLKFKPGQFALIYIEAKDGWHRHPFTITSAPHDEFVRLTVKALGDYTSRIGQTLEPGMPAVISGPHGRFDMKKGTDKQIWIGAGAGIAPFLSWIRSLGPDFNQQVEFFYSSAGKAPYADEIIRIAKSHPTLHVHFVNTSTQARLSPGSVIKAAGQPLKNLTVYMCGPQQMLKRFQSRLLQAGVPRSHILHEYFEWR